MVLIRSAATTEEAAAGGDVVFRESSAEYFAVVLTDADIGLDRGKDTVRLALAAWATPAVARYG